jgi:hypothetical protein
MPSYVIRNENFRDEVLKYSYPFDEQSELESQELYIGTDLFIDAVFYIKTDAELPLYIGVVDGTSGTIGQAKIIIYDARGTNVGECVVDGSTEACSVLSRGIPVGALVFNPEGLQRFIGRVSGKVINLLPDVASFLLDCCHVNRTRHLRAVNAGKLVSGDVRIVARHGCRFVVDSQNRLRLDILAGDQGLETRQPVTSINGVRNTSIWLENHPRANLRISTENGHLTFAQAKDLK